MVNSNNPLIEAALQEYRAILEGSAPAPTPVVDPLVAQRNMILNKQMQDRQAAQQRTIDEAQAKDRQAKADRVKEQAQAQEAEAERLEASTKEQARAEWLQAGGYASDFEKQWRQQYMSIQQTRAAEHDELLRARFRQRYGG